MRFTERMRGLKKWIYETLCEGRMMKAPAPDMDIGTIHRQEPRVYFGWAPSRMDNYGNILDIPQNVCPGILVMPNQSYAKIVDERQHNRYDGVHHPKEMGQQLSVSILFSVYEPGVRLPGFVDSVGNNGQGLDMNLILEGTEEGLFTLMNWMDDCMDNLLGQKVIPETDLFVYEDTVTYSLYTDQSYVTDRRPMFYGFINVVFGCYAEEKTNPDIERLLK